MTECGEGGRISGRHVGCSGIVDDMMSGGTSLIVISPYELLTGAMNVMIG